AVGGKAGSGTAGDLERAAGNAWRCGERGAAGYRGAVAAVGSRTACAAFGRRNAGAALSVHACRDGGRRGCGGGGRGVAGGIPAFAAIRIAAGADFGWSAPG